MLRKIEELIAGLEEGKEPWRRILSHTYLPAEEGVMEAPAVRYRRLLQSYTTLFPENREVAFARAPGRVNLIGEHTDYNDGPVLPAAVDRDIAAVFTPRSDGTVRIHEAGGSFGGREFEIRESIPPFAQGDWGNYVKAGVQGLVREDRRRGGGLQSGGRENERVWRGFDALVDGTIPPAGGLSSSSALVVLAGLLFLKSNGLSMEGKELAGVMAEAEYYVGTRGGGMDQAASVLGEAGKALKIDFADFSIQSVLLPEDCTLIVAHSLVPAAKSAAARRGYNLRAAECRIAAELFRRRLSQQLGREIPERSIGTLRRYLEGMSERDREELIERAFPGRFTPERLEKEYGFSPDILQREYFLEPDSLAAEAVDAADVAEPTEAVEPFQRELKLKSRFLHVIGECERVERLCSKFERGDIAAAGELMNESHRSCRDLFEISCRELDRLTEIERRSGAWGARMTGAGFGGCTVALVPRETAGAFRERLIEEYYRGELGEERREYGDIVFPVRPAPGAGLL